MGNQFFEEYTENTTAGDWGVLILLGNAEERSGDTALKRWPQPQWAEAASKS
jgi:hypothetical protein